MGIICDIGKFLIDNIRDYMCCFLFWPGITIDAPIGKVVVSLIQETNNFLPIGAETNFVKKTSNYMGGQGVLSPPQNEKTISFKRVTISSTNSKSPKKWQYGSG